MKVELTQEHEWLRQLVGDWTYWGECPTSFSEGAPKERLEGHEQVRSLRDLWIVAEAEGPSPEPGVPALSLTTVGFDPKRGRFVGQWIGSMMNYQWLYEGSLSEDRQSLILNSEGPGMTEDGALAKYRDIHEIVSATERALYGEILTEAGKWHRFMETHYTRVE